MKVPSDARSPAQPGVVGPSASASAETVDPSDANAPPPPSPPGTRASNLDASEAGLQTSAIPPDGMAASGRYVLTAFHARGGMGEVWRCRDTALGREVALKRLASERHAARERFLCEAQVAGQLQHPGIVSVHDLGFGDGGRPFYVMTFVQGRTLKSAIDELYADPPRPVEQRQVERTRLLNIFLDVCHAVAYAHSRGVIHRDVKPDNVMLGTYGETILLDWGLAKLRGQVDSRHGDGADGGGGGGDQSGVTSRPGIPSVPHPPAALSGHSARTEDGSILGSPLYMPPEMAHGHVVDADQRTDVYLLGATLYEILAGRPPRQGASRDEILEMARTAPLVPPRHFQSDTPRALQAICLKAMATDKSRRYESAMQLADDVQRFLAGEVVSAYREPLAARAWRWARRRRVALARCASAGVLVACAAAGLLVYRDAERVKAREIARDQVERFRHLADEAHYYGAGSNAPGEIAPYYDTTRARDAARAALALTDQWGVTLQHLPLTSQRPDIRRELAELCQRLAQLQLAGGVGGCGRQDAATTSSQVFALLDR